MTDVRINAPLADDETGAAERQGNPRAALRNRLFLIGIVPTLLALLFAGKVALMLSHNDDGRSAYDDGSFSVARGEFAANSPLNLLEAWISPYNEGTARYQLKDYPGAISRFESALEDVPTEQECTVRINLALTQEAVGDAAAEGSDREAAVKAWESGRAVLAEGKCPTDAGLGQEQSETAATVDQRLADKLTDAGEPPPQQQGDKPDQQPPPDEGDKSKEEELERRNNEGRQGRRDSEDLDDYDIEDDYAW